MNRHEFWSCHKRKVKYTLGIVFAVIVGLFAVAYALSLQAAAIFNMIAARQHFLEGTITVGRLTATPLGMFTLRILSGPWMKAVRK